MSLLRPFRMACLLGCLLVGCESTPKTPVAPPRAHTFVIAALMAANPAPDLGEAELQEVSAGHFANMKHMRDAGQLLLAGPAGDPDSEFRGLFLFDCESVEEAREFSANDPAIQAGLLQPEFAILRTDAPLGELPRLGDEARARRLALDPDDPAEGFAGRAYVLATCNRGLAAERALSKMIRAGRVLFHGDLGPPFAGSALVGFDVETVALFVLDVETVAGAEVQLENAGAFRGLGADWALDLWWASEVVTELPALTSGSEPAR